MTARPVPNDAHKLANPYREALATAIRERSVTNANTTLYGLHDLYGVRRWWIAATFAILAACGGGQRADTYARASDVQGSCCEHLAGGARDTCLRDVVRIDDAAVAQSDANQKTYACVVDHFVCDPATGHPTQPSAQAQLECIQDLP
jgi:hypothetical protein